MDAVSDRPRRWNHNTQYHPVILGAVAPGCRRSLDVGCGEGMLARELRRVVPHVTAIDRDEASIDVARRQDDEGIDYILGDFLTHPFQPASFDLIASIAALHHMDAAAALERMRGLQTRRLARRLLPGVRYRRLLLWRYSLVWTKPTVAAQLPRSFSASSEREPGSAV